jgi:glycosyltransferase involved in cell wall biosynthesis
MRTANPTNGRVIVANPGGVSWMAGSAASLSRAGKLAAYCSPMVVSQPELNRLEKRFTRPAGQKLVSQLSRRAAPPELSSEQIVRVGNFSELLYVLAPRLGLPVSVWSAFTRNRALTFDRAVSRRVTPGMGAVIGYQSTTQRTFEVARRLGVGTVLDYPIPHWPVVEQLMLEEARLVPEYAATLQGHDIEPWRKQRSDAEIELADRLIMLCTYHQRTFESLGIDPARMFIAPLCVDPDLFTPAPELPGGTFKIAFAGQITQRKGISYLVEGFKRAELEDAELLMIGRPVGTTEPWINEPRVTYVPAMPRPQLPEVFRSAHVTVLPSILEGFGATALEGMACGLPAIVTENSLAHDVIEDGVDGWVLPIRDADGIARCLRTLYDDRNLLASMGKAARRKAEQYPWDRYGQAVLDGIAPLLDRS